MSRKNAIVRPGLKSGTLTDWNTGLPTEPIVDVRSSLISIFRLKRPTAVALKKILRSAKREIQDTHRGLADLMKYALQNSRQQF